MFSTSQLISILKPVSSVKTRITLVGEIGPRLIDPKEHADELLSLFRFADEKEKIEEVLKARQTTLSSSHYVKSAGVGISSRPSSARLSNDVHSLDRPGSILFNRSSFKKPNTQSVIEAPRRNSFTDMNATITITPPTSPLRRVRDDIETSLSSKNKVRDEMSATLSSKILLIKNPSPKTSRSTTMRTNRTPLVKDISTPKHSLQSPCGSTDSECSMDSFESPKQTSTSKTTPDTKPITVVTIETKIATKQKSLSQNLANLNSRIVSAFGSITGTISTPAPSKHTPDVTPNTSFRRQTSNDSISAVSTSQSYILDKKSKMIIALN